MWPILLIQSMRPTLTLPYWALSWSNVNVDPTDDVSWCVGLRERWRLAAGAPIELTGSTIDPFLADGIWMMRTSDNVNGLNVLTIFILGLFGNDSSLTQVGPINAIFDGGETVDKWGTVDTLAALGEATVTGDNG